MKRIITSFLSLGCIYISVAQNVGIGTTLPKARLHVTDSSVLFSGGDLVSLPAPPPPISGPGIRMMWYVSKASLRAGAVNGTAWDADSIGPYSFASGFNSKALGYNAVSLGNGTVARANYTTSFGVETQATGEYATSMGLFTMAKGSASTSMGIATTANGDAATAIGYYTTAKASGAFSAGVYSDTSESSSPTAFASTDRLFQIGNGTFGNLKNALTVLRNGNMGIGITTPGAKLHVLNGSSGYSGSGGYFPGAILEDASNTYFNIITPGGIESGLLFGNPLDLANGGIIYNNAGNASGLQFRTNGNATRMVIDNAGRVGIGTQSPNAPLQFASTTSNRKIVMYEGTNNDHQFYGFGVNGFTLRYQTPAVTDDHIFYSGINSSSSRELLRIRGNGNVGIGYSTPLYILEVNGRMRIRSGGNNSVSAGIWLNNNANSEVAFIGMEDDTHVGFFGNDGAGWKFGMNTQTGALKINGSEGIAGQLLQSNGASSPSWTNPLNALYNNLTEHSQTVPIVMLPQTVYSIPGLSNTSLVITSVSKVIISASIEVERSACGGCGSSEEQLFIQMTPPLVNVVNSSLFLFPGEKSTVTIGMKFLTLNPNTYTINTYVFSGVGSNATARDGRLNIIIIPQ